MFYSVLNAIKSNSKVCSVNFEPPTDHQHQTGGSNCEMFDHVASVHIKSCFTLKEKKAY